MDDIKAPRSGYDFRRSPTIFVMNVNAERRKNILRVRYHSQNACEVHHKLDYLRVLLTLIGCLIVLGSSFGFEVKQDAYVFRAPSSYWACAGFVCIMIAAIYEVLRYVHYKQRAVMISGSLNVTCFILLCVSFGLRASQVPERSLDIMGLIASVFALTHAIVFNIAYRTFAGLYAPIVPSTHAPTVIPISALYTIGAAGLLTAFAMALVAGTTQRVSGFVRAQKSCLIGAFVCWTLAAWGELGIVFVASQNVKRRQIHRDQLETEQIEQHKKLNSFDAKTTVTGGLLDDEP